MSCKGENDLYKTFRRLKVRTDGILGMNKKEDEEKAQWIIY